MLGNMIDNYADALEMCPVLNKQKPRHKWLAVSEISTRQYGESTKTQNSRLFQKKFYGSLHCVQRLELMYKLKKHERLIKCLNFHPNGDLLVSVCADNKAVLWDWNNGNSLLSFNTNNKNDDTGVGIVTQCKFLSFTDDLHIATSSWYGEVRVAQVSKQDGLRSSRKLGSHRRSCRNICGSCYNICVLNYEPYTILSTGVDAVVLRHDIRSSCQEEILKVNNGVREVPLFSINSNPCNSNEFCVAGEDYLIRTYDQRQCSNNKTLNEYHPNDLRCEDAYVGSATYNYNGTEILASYNDEDVYLFDNNGRKGFIHHYQGHKNGGSRNLVNFFGPKSEFIISGSGCAYVYFWEKNTEAIVQWLSYDSYHQLFQAHPQLPILCMASGWNLDVWLPTAEEEPQMDGLHETVKKNFIHKTEWKKDLNAFVL